MKRYTDLTPEQQHKAVEKAASEVLTLIVEGAVRFADELNHDDLQARIDAAIEKADEMQTPWFAHEYVMDTCRDDILSMARADAEDAWYPEGETVLEGIA